GHLGRGQDPLGRVGGGHAEEVPHCRPEGIQVGHGPAPQIPVAVEVEPALRLKPAQVPADDRPFTHIVGWYPQYTAVVGETLAPLLALIPPRNAGRWRLRAPRRAPGPRP